MAFGFLKKAVRTAGRGLKKVGKGVGKVGKGVGKGIGKGVKVVGKVPGIKEVGKGVKLVGKAGRSVGKVIGKVPVVGGGLKGVYNLTINKPFQIASDVASGKRIDQVAVRAIKREVQSVRDVAPYAQTVISIVPGVGTGLSAGLSAGLALASGQPISSAIAAAVKGAIPGGALAKSAFDVGQAAIQGKPISSVALAALPLNAQEKKALAMGLDAAGRIAKGQRVDKALIAQADKAISLLPKDAAKALNLGIAVQEAKNLQNIAIKAVKPQALDSLKAGGTKLIGTSPILSAAGKVITNQAERAGFSVGIGMMAHTIRPIDAVAIRSRLNAQQKKGFDMAVAARAGMIDSKLRRPKTVSTPAEAFGYYTTRGLTGTQNTGAIIRAVANPKAPTGKGATVALKKIEVENKSWWHRLVSYLKGE